VVSARSSPGATSTSATASTARSREEVLAAVSVDGSAAAADLERVRRDRVGAGSAGDSPELVVDASAEASTLAALGTSSACPGAPAVLDADRVRVRRVAVVGASDVAAGGATTGSGAWKSIAGAATRRAERDTRGAGSGDSVAAKGDSAGGAAFLVARRAGFFTGGAAVSDAAAAVAGASTGADPVLAGAASVFFAVLRRAVAFFVVAAAAGSVPADGVSLPVTFFVARFRAVFLAGAVPSVVVSVVFVVCSVSSMDGAPVVPRAPVSAPHGDCVKSGLDLLCRKACGWG